MQPSSGARCLIFGQTLCLLPYFMCANSEGPGETAQMCRLAWAFAGRLCDKYHNLMSWLKRQFNLSVNDCLSIFKCRIAPLHEYTSSTFQTESKNVAEKERKICKSTAWRPLIFYLLKLNTWGSQPIHADDIIVTSNDKLSRKSSTHFSGVIMVRT